MVGWWRRRQVVAPNTLPTGVRGSASECPSAWIGFDSWTSSPWSVTAIGAIMVDSSRDDTSAVTLATLRMTTTALLATTDEEALIASRLDELLAAFDPTSTADREFWGAQFDLGLAWVPFPRWRRRARSEPRHQQTVMERLAGAGAPTDNVTRNVIGHGMGAPTVLTHGTEEQRRRWLRPLFTAEEIWCQLFSEPGAGSDVAALATRGSRR